MHKIRMDILVFHSLLPTFAKRTIESAEEPILLIDCDHDLGDYAYDGGDGIKLLDWLAENDRFYPIRLHTMNPVGRENMLRMIRRYW